MTKKTKMGLIIGLSAVSVVLVTGGVVAATLLTIPETQQSSTGTTQTNKISLENK